MTSTATWLYRFLGKAVLSLCIAALFPWAAWGQAPIPMREQIERFNSLPPAQQQALIRELQGELPPAQRQAIVDMLQGGGRAGQQAAAASVDPRQLAELDRLLQQQQAEEPEPEEREPRFGGGDTLVMAFELRDERVPRERDDTEIETEIADLQQRLAEGNPYELDDAGQLYLPGIPAIALAGLNVEQARVRLEAEPGLKAFDLEVTRLPLEPIGTEALEPFGYDLFEDERRTFFPVTNIPVPTDYVVGPGDTVNVQLFGNSNAEYFLVVNRDGTVNFPEIGPLNVSGLRFSEVRNLVNERVSEQMIGVRASTTLGELRSIQVFVVGDVENPGSYTVGGIATITTALFESGGVSEIGSLRNITLRREGGVVSTLDLYDLLLRGDTSGDARLQPGDAIFVPPIGPAIAVDGEVRRPAIYEIDDETTVAEVIQLAGGLNANANRGQLRLERISQGGGIDVRNIDASALEGQGISVRDGDVLRVTPNPSLLEGSVRLAGNVYQPGLHQWSQGMRLTDLLPRSGVVKPLSDLNYVLIRRELEPNVRIDVVSADLEAAWRQPGSAKDVVLEPRDTVYVFNLDIGRQHIVKPILEEFQVQAPPKAPHRIVRVSGRVRAPGEYPLEPGMRVSDLLRAGGGMSESAYATEAELTRYAVVNGEYRETELLTVDLAALLNGDEQADLAIAPYDFLSIKEVPRWRGNETVTLRGEITFPGSYPIRQGETLSSVLDRAGGLTTLAFPEGSVFTRVELREREREQLETLARRIESDLATISVSDPENADAVTTGQSLINQLRDAVATGRLVIQLDELLAGNEDADISLRAGDELFVPQYRQEVTVLGEVQYATSHVFSPELDRRDYLSRSGGLTSRADDERIYVVRANGEVVVDRGGRWFRRSVAEEIRPGDTIVVPTDVDRVRPLARWSSITTILYNIAIAAAAVQSF